jgi:membrane-associated phospholipid phosphatase
VSAKALWVGLFLVWVLAVLGAKALPFFPGDVAVERWVQSQFPGNLGWAEGFSKTAEFPWILLIQALITGLAWTLAGWRGAVISLLSLAGMLALGQWLGPLIARPRPTPELVHVFRTRSGYSLPSLFALRYAATFGFFGLLALARSSGLRRAVLPALCGALLLIGGLVRVALGAHWPSDVIISYYTGLLWAALLLRFAPSA